MIPQIVHQTWIGEKIPDSCRKYVDSIKSNFKGWEYVLWTDKECEKLLKSEYNNIYNIFLKAPNNGFKSDLFRYCIMHKFGGFYFDLDYQIYKDFTFIENFKNYELFLFYENEPFFKVFGVKNVIANCAMGSQKNSEFFKLILKYIESDILFKIARSSYPLEFDYIDNTLFKTGPFFLTKVFEIYKNKLDINKVFLGESKKFTFNRLNNETYGIHYCQHSWYPKNK